MCSCTDIRSRIRGYCIWLTSFCWRPDPFDPKNPKLLTAIQTLSKNIKDFNTRSEQATKLKETLKGMINLSKKSYSNEQKAAAAKIESVIRDAGLHSPDGEEEILPGGGWCCLSRRNWCCRNRPVTFDEENPENPPIIRAVVALSKTIDHFKKRESDAIEKRDNYRALLSLPRCLSGISSELEQTLYSELDQTISGVAGTSFPFLPYTGSVSQSGSSTSTVRKRAVPNEIKTLKEAIEAALRKQKYIGTSLINHVWHNLEHRKLLVLGGISREEIGKVLPYLSQEWREDLEAIGI